VKHIVHARYWNDADWIEASLAQLRRWNADVTIISEGNWDPAWEARSTDGTLDRIKAFIKEWRAEGRRPIHLIWNDRSDPNYRKNQARTANNAVKLAAGLPGDWMTIVDSDHIYQRQQIEFVKALIQSNPPWDYIVVETLCFFYRMDSCQFKWDDMGTKVPYRLLRKAYWKPTCQLCINNKLYRQIDSIQRWTAHSAQLRAFHYEGMRSRNRLRDKYQIGDRQPFWTYKDGVRVREVKTYCGPHPEDAVPALRKMGYL
jgi:hypothetical protein